MTDVIDMLWNQLQTELDQIRTQIRTTTLRTERAETAGGVSSMLLADAPLFVDGAGPGDLLWISNGRKSGETAGNGTGVLAAFNDATNTWLNVADYTTVTT